MEVGCMDCYSNLLGKSEIGEERAPCLNSEVAGPTEMKGGGGSLVRLDVTFPLEASVPEGLYLVEGTVGGYPSRNCCGGCVL